MVHDALSADCGTQVLLRVDNALSKKNHFNFKPICRAYPYVYIILGLYVRISYTVKRLWP